MLFSDSVMLRIVLLNWGNGKHNIKQIIPCVMGLKFCLVKKQVCVFWEKYTRSGILLLFFNTQIINVLGLVPHFLIWL